MDVHATESREVQHVSPQDLAISHDHDHVITMLRENKRDEALRSLDEFRKMYPDYHLPDDLRDLK